MRTRLALAPLIACAMAFGGRSSQALDIPRPNIPRPTINVPRPTISVPHPTVSVPHPTVPHPTVSVPRPTVSAPHPIVSAPHPVISKPAVSVNKQTVSSPSSPSTKNPVIGKPELPVASGIGSKTTSDPNSNPKTTVGSKNTGDLKNTGNLKNTGTSTNTGVKSTSDLKNTGDLKSTPKSSMATQSVDNPQKQNNQKGGGGNSKDYMSRAGGGVATGCGEGGAPACPPPGSPPSGGAAGGQSGNQGTAIAPAASSNPIRTSTASGAPVDATYLLMGGPGQPGCPSCKPGVVYNHVLTSCPSCTFTFNVNAAGCSTNGAACWVPATTPTSTITGLGGSTGTTSPPTPIQNIPGSAPSGNIGDANSYQPNLIERAAAALPDIPPSVANFIGGFGNAVSFGATNAILSAQGFSNPYDTNSTAYNVGTAAGVATIAVISSGGGAGAAEGVATEGAAAEGAGTASTATEGAAGTASTATEGAGTASTATEGAGTASTATEGAGTASTATEGAGTASTATEGTAGTASEGGATTAQSPPSGTTAQATDSAGAAGDSGNGLPPKLYHYTSSENVDSIMENGLGAGGRPVYTTPAGDLSPTQAQIELALPPNRGYPNATIEIDTPTLQQQGIKPAAGPQPVMSTTNAGGGGTEIIFDQPIPPSALKVVPKSGP
jgi:hypothetical protein